MANKRRELDSEINTGSMADIAFLLLIFFLVTTTIEMDKGIMVKLPPWVDTPPTPLNEDNVFSVKINAENDLLVEKELAIIESLKERTKEFIMNPQKREDLPPSPKKAIISLQNDRSTSYKTYLEVYNELKAAYNELWNDKAHQWFGKKYDDLTKADQKSIRDEIPLVISEAEPTDHLQ